MQLLWMKQMLANYKLSQDKMNLFIHLSSAIQFSKNPIQHSRTKHIDVQHHFIRELVEAKTIFLEYVATEDQLVDILTKALDSKMFEYLQGAMRMCLI